MALTTNSFGRMSKFWERIQRGDMTAHCMALFKAEAQCAMDDADRGLTEVLLRIWSQHGWSELGGTYRRARLFQPGVGEHKMQRLVQTIEESWSTYFGKGSGIAVRYERATNVDSDEFYYKWAREHPDAVEKHSYVEEAVKRYQERPEVKAKIEESKKSE